MCVCVCVYVCGLTCLGFSDFINYNEHLLPSLLIVFVCKFVDSQGLLIFFIHMSLYICSPYTYAVGNLCGKCVIFQHLFTRSINMQLFFILYHQKSWKNLITVWSINSSVLKVAGCTCEFTYCKLKWLCLQIATYCVIIIVTRIFIIVEFLLYMRVFVYWNCYNMSV